MTPTEARARSYGITGRQLAWMTLVQQGQCGICRRQSDRLVIDHDHLTQKVRGLLCPSCNTGLGMFRDNPDRLRAAADYLEETVVDVIGLDP